MNNNIEEAADDRTEDCHECKGDGQRHFNGVRDRRQHHSGKHCSTLLRPGSAANFKSVGTTLKIMKQRMLKLRMVRCHFRNYPARLAVAKSALQQKAAYKCERARRGNL